MGAAYFIVLDNPDPGFDPFVNGKAIAREANRLSRVAASIGLKTLDDYFSIGADDAVAMSEDLGLTFSDDLGLPAEQWFDAEEGLAWVGRLQAHLQANPNAVKDADALLADLAEYEQVLSQAKAAGAKWHLMVDF